jgi:hypothetical protein
MKKILFGTLLLALAIAVPIPAMAGVDVSISIGLPPPILFPAPPAVIVLPDTDYVYVDPDIDVELYFWGGWWWRFWEGRWYRSYYYDRGWAFYRYVPRFYYDVDPGWRGHYREHNWYGHRWDYERIPNQRLKKNWKSWHDNRYWERQRTWGVQGYQPRPQRQMQELRRERQQQYQRRPDVQRHQQEMKQRQRQPQIQQPRGQQPRQPQVQPEERGRVIRPQSGPPSSPATRGEMKQVKPEKKTKRAEPERDRGSRDEGRHEER